MTEFVFWAALAVLAYTYVGFPSLIWMLAQILPRAVRRSTYQPRVAVIIVAHNEAAGIVHKIESCLAQSYPKEKL
ncbi:MAG: glycosyltransferase family 2 protein, partial [Acidobacteria bacterium]